MSPELIVLCVAALALLSALGSLVVVLALPGLDALARTLAPAQRTRLWLGAAWTPLAFAVTTVLVALLPALLGHDHCLGHEAHHPHLCPRHAGALHGWTLMGVAGSVALRFAWATAMSIRRLVVSARTARALDLAGELHDGARVFDDARPQAFVLGAMRPAVYVSSALFGLGPQVVHPVIAHERAHVAGRDLLWRGWCSVLGACHLPAVGQALGRRLAAAQEMRADERAAEQTGDRTGVAEALLTLARAGLRGATLGVSIVHGDVESRVRALLAPQVAQRPWILPALLGTSLASLALLGAEQHWVHHAVETLLGALSHV